MANDTVGSAWYELGLRDEEVRSKLRSQEGEFRRAGEQSERAWATPLERATGRVAGNIDDVVSELNALRGKAPEELARSFERAADSADEAFDAVRKLSQGDDLDTAKARKYAEALDEIGVEADQTLADLRELQAADPRFNTPQLQEAAAQLDRVGTEAREAASNLNQMKGVGADTHLERLAHEAREGAVGLDQAAAKSDGLLGKLKGVKGVLAGLGLAIGAQQLLSFAGDARDAFIDLERSTKSVDKIFGASADTIEAWARRSAHAAGLSKRTVNESAAVMGQGLKNVGFDASASADTVVRLQQRAADLAATFGGETSDAIAAVGSLLRGERDPIDKYGVTIKQADVNARILALGLDTSTEAAKRHAEAVATLDLFWEQSSDSAGRFASSTDDVGVAMERNQAKIENGMAEIGRNVASIQLGAVRVAEAIGEHRAPLRDALDDFALNFGELGNRVHRISDQVGIDFDTMKQRVADRMAETGETVEEALAAIEGHYYATSERVPASTTELMNASIEAYRARKAEMEAAANEVLSDPVVVAMLGGKEEAERIAGETPGAIAQALLDNQFSVEDAMGSLAQAGEAGLHPLIERAKIIAFLSSGQLAAGLASGIPAVAARANDLKAAAEARLAELSGSTWAYGNSAGTSFGDGLTAAYGYVYSAAGGLAAAVRNQIGIQSEPPDHRSPLYGHMKWGGNLVRDFIDSAMYAKPDLDRAMAMLFDVPAFGPSRSASLIPQLASAGLGAQSAMPASGGSVQIGPFHYAGPGGPAEAERFGTHVTDQVVRELVQRQIIARPRGAY